LSNSALVLENVDWATLAPLAGAGLTATLCSGADPGCTAPLAPPYAVQDGRIGDLLLPAGVAGVPAPEGFDGFVKFDVATAADTPDAQRFMSSTYYLPGTLLGDFSVGPTVLMAQQGTFGDLVQSSFPGVPLQAVRERGVVQVTAYDCNGEPVPDARIEIVVGDPSAPDVIPFQLPPSRIPIVQPPGQALYSASGGAVGYLAVPPGSVQVSAYLGADVEPFGIAQLGAVAGQLTYGVIRPNYFLNASIPTSFDSLGAAP